jgi:hypothetical protein
MRFRTLLLGYHDDRCIERIGTALDRMDPESRLWTMLSIEPEEQCVLWNLMKDRPVDADHFVPSSLNPGDTVVHHGRNTLPVMKFFQKRFCRDEDGAIWGHNAQPLSWLTGPGFFQARAADGSGMLIDYSAIPSKVPPGWPTPKSNDGGVGRLVYGGMNDQVRAVSSHVCIGRAFRRGKAMNAHFVLCRQDPS